ncbi:MAG: efflux RND transporter periplasmic adaptor subunit [Lewinellaceae bacterium]|nr:efflux RND transporter periplasmic adaptor subunit [Saprospiraceae bacterium]MCB9331277.1 efflux RND transporter periplasmic adaptor subunit [Lewinellaceae bacterium]
MKYPLITLSLLLSLAACKDNGPQADAYGNFETDEMIVSAEASGRILELNLEEGQVLSVGQTLGRIDSTQLVLKKEQLQAAIRAIAAKSPAISAQLAVFEKQVNTTKQQLSALKREKQRVESLLKSDAATPKQLDDLNDQIVLAERQMDVILEQRSATDATLSTQKSGLLAEILPLQKQIAQLEDQIEKCHIVNPTAGTVLSTYAEPGEIATFGKPLYKLANLDHMILRAYVAGDQLGNVQLGQSVKVAIDAPDGAMQEFPGKVTWISSKAEFTPKIIQTKSERVNLVYAVKIEVENPEGKLKIGMPGEVRL